MKQLVNFQEFSKQGEPLILIHGLFGSLENLNMVAKPLSENFHVYSVDVRNHGSSFHQENMSYEKLAQDIIDLLDHLSIEGAHILGHSMGGKIAMQLALNFPSRVKKLIVADIAPVQYPAHHESIISGLKSINFNEQTTRKSADTQLAKFVYEPTIRQFLLKNLTEVQGRLGFKCNLNYIASGYVQIMQAIKASAPFTGETLFIKGGNSTYIIADYQEAIIELFPHAQAKIIANTGHWLHAEKPIAFNKLVSDFLS